MPSMISEHSEFGMVTIQDIVYAVAGWNSNKMEKFENGTWTPLQSLPRTIDGHCVVALNNNRIMLIGGSIYSGSIYNTVSKL